MRLSYAIKYVADMDRAIAFHRDVLGLHLKFGSPFWTEFVTGETTSRSTPPRPSIQRAASSSVSRPTISAASTNVGMSLG